MYGLNDLIYLPLIYLFYFFFINLFKVFISPNVRDQNYAYSTPSPPEEGLQEDSFDEIECLRAEVKRLSDIVNEQSDVISFIQKAFKEVKNPFC